MKRIVCGDVLRIVATVAVVLLHIVANKWAYTDYNTMEWNIYNILNASVRWCVPMFFMLSGMVFLEQKREISLKKIYGKYVVRILAALMFWGMFYQIYNQVYYNKEMNLISIRNIFITVGLNGGKYHLWFLFTIIGLYIILPLLRVFISKASRKELLYAIIIIFVISGIYPIGNYFISFRGVHEIPIISEYIGMFLLGYYLRERDFSKKSRTVIYALGIASYGFTIIGTILATKWKATPNPIFFMYYAPNVLLMATSIFVFCKSLFNKITLSQKKASVIYYLSSCTFGVYLLHPLFLDLLSNYGIGIRLSTVIPITLGICIACFIVTAIIKKIPIIRDYII